MDEAAAAALVIGIGNPDRGDDAAGSVLARRLAGMLPPGMHVIEHDGEPSSLLAHLAEATRAVLVDASAPLGRPGTVRRFDVSTTPLPAVTFQLSSHGLGLADAIELARTLGQLPARCIVYTIEAEAFDAGALLSAPVAKAVRIVADEVLAELTR